MKDFGGVTFWSVLMILVGAVFLGVNLGVLSRELARYWPLILVVIGLVGLSGGLGTGKKKK